MVIAEALNKIKDLEKERREIGDKLNKDVFILPDLEVAPATIEELIETYQSLTADIAELKIKVIATNVTNRVEFVDVKGSVVKITIMAAIKMIETYRHLESRYSNLADVMESKRARFFSQGGFGSEQPIKLKPNFQTLPTDLRKEVTAFRDGARRVEQAVIKANWNTELIGG